MNFSRMKAVITCAHSPTASDVTQTLSKDVATTHVQEQMLWSPSISEHSLRH